jgi:hypothetical protein
VRTVLAVLMTCGVAWADKVTLVAGDGDGADGTEAAKAKVVQPFAVDFTADGTVYFVEMVGGERFRTIDKDGKVYTLAGSGKKGNTTGDGDPLKAEFNGMHNLAVSGTTVYLADTFNGTVRTFDLHQGVRRRPGTEGRVQGDHLHRPDAGRQDAVRGRYRQQAGAGHRHKVGGGHHRGRHRESRGAEKRRTGEGPAAGGPAGGGGRR